MLLSGDPIDNGLDACAHEPKRAISKTEVEQEQADYDAAQWHRYSLRILFHPPSSSISYRLSCSTSQL
jgi:hypothetical protein